MQLFICVDNKYLLRLNAQTISFPCLNTTYKTSALNSVKLVAKIHFFQEENVNILNRLALAIESYFGVRTDRHNQ